jgi:hypothetical protein
MRVRAISFAALALLVAGSLHASSVSLKATGTFGGKPVAFDRTSDRYFSEAFVNRDGENRPNDLVLNFGDNVGTDKFRWEFRFVSPVGTAVEPGTYVSPARDLATRKGDAFMFITAVGADIFRCDDTTLPTAGRLVTINDLKLLETDDVDHFQLSFVEKCGEDTLTGTIAFGVNGLPTGGGTDDGGGTTTPPAPFQIQFPTDFDVEPLILTNSASQTISFQTLVDATTFNSDLHLSVATDALDDENFHATLTPDTIAAPGAGNSKVTITTGPLTFPRVYRVTLTAAANDQTFSRSFLVHVVCDPPFILGTNQPKSITAPNGSQVTLEVKPSGSGPFLYQWFRGVPGMTRNPVLAANESKLIFTTRETATYWVRVSNACGTVNSNPVTVTTTGSLAGPSRRRS